MGSLKYKIFVINMPGSKERWEYVKTQLDGFKADYERVEGIDVSKLSEGELDKYYSYSKNRKTYPKPLTRGEIGCHMAHIKCWEEALRRNLDFAVVLEDDISIDDRFPEALKFLESHPSGWDFIRLQAETKPRRLYFKEDFGSFSIYEYIRHSGCMWGYALNSKAAKTLVESLLPFGMTADSNMHAYYRFGIDVKTLIPPVIFARPNNDSDIECASMRKKQRNFYPFARQVFSLRHYLGRLVQLAKRDGTGVFLRRIAGSRNILT